MTFEKSTMIYAPREINNRHIGAAKRALKKEKEKAGLFPELMRFNSVEERLSQIEENSKEFARRNRNSDAQFWLKARSDLKTLPVKTQKKILEKWNNPDTRHVRAEAFRFASLVTSAKRYPARFEHEEAYNAMSNKTKALTCRLATTINTNGNIRKLKGFISRLEKRYGIKVGTYTFSTYCLHVSVNSDGAAKALMQNKDYIEKQLRFYFMDMGYKITNEVIYFNAYKRNTF